MFSWFRRRKPKQDPVLTAPGERLYAIGDVHGRIDLLEDLLARIEADRDAHPHDGQTTLVFLGDYVDRGMDSAAVVDRMRTLDLPQTNLVCLRGNHEQSLLDIGRDRASERDITGWLTYGGRETLSSYRVPADIVYSSDAQRVAEAVQATVPASHLDWLAELQHTHISGDYLFVHAGIRPGVPLEEQEAHDFLWIRDGFLDHAGSHGHIVVHGHSIALEVQFRANRIGIDTGAYATGVLTALVLDGDTQRLIQTRGGD